MRIVILPYKMGSASARVLQRKLQDMGLSCIRVYPDRKYRPKADDFIVNWGYSGDTKGWDNHINLNDPLHVQKAINKLSCLMTLKEHDVDCVEFTVDRDEAKEWETIYVRHKLCSTCGNGIEVLHRGDTLPYAPLYTKGIQTLREYRVHIMLGEVIDYTKKRRKNDKEYEEGEILVRNHKNGWVFCRENLRRLDRVEKVAIRAVEALNLAFGAVDIVMDEDGVARVLEVNTAIGLEGTTLENYANKIKELASQSG